MTKGSYNFEELDDAGFQTERLRQQAQAVRSLESGILRSAGLQPGHDVLEVGAGPGFITDLLAELAPEGSVHAVEPSAALVAQIEGNVQRKPARGLYPIQAYGNAVPIDDRSIDFAYARFVLQHVPQPDNIVKEIHRVLRPGGHLCVVDSDDGLVVLFPEDPLVNQILQTAQSTQRERGGDRFIGRKLQKMISEAGFINVRSRILALTNSELPFGVLFNILLGYKALLIKGASDLKTLYDDLSRRVATGRQLVAGGVFIVTGEKPST